MLDFLRRDRVFRRGKSSVIEALKARGFPCVDEPGRQIVQEQMRNGTDATPWQEQTKLPEVVAASRLLRIPVPEDAAVANYRYARKVFVMPPWPELFQNDAERRHSFEDALTEYPLTLEAYRECGYELMKFQEQALRSA